MDGFNEASNPFEKIKPRFHYTYSDNKVLGHPVICEFDANDDFAAAQKFAEFLSESEIDISDSEIVRTVIEN
jgi:hypothetical protein